MSAAVVDLWHWGNIGVDRMVLAVLAVFVGGDQSGSQGMLDEGRNRDEVGIDGMELAAPGCWRRVPKQ